jgi:Rps23 Pro-64 3,4-dihydroxylase Tpa1-like proline 4-hydroxylase
LPFLGLRNSVFSVVSRQRYRILQEAAVINPTIRQQVQRYRRDFDSALPFRHVVLDDFFESEHARHLLVDFPPFHPDNARNEFGGVGRKAVIQEISRISPFYAEVYQYIAAKEFLDVISAITGIRDLIHDEKMFGGGTHENLEGQELDPHVDFNFLEDRKLHRRLNALLYLNTEWEETWGGCLELHSNPRRPRENRIKVVKPGFNRCVIFETSEYSWHGFEKIRLPEGKKHLSRKLLSIYLYTRDRPLAEIVPPHSTFYVQRPMPVRIKAGYTLRQEDVRQIEELFQRRDDWIEHYQKKELKYPGKTQDIVGQLGQISRKTTRWFDRVRRLGGSLNPSHGVGVQGPSSRSESLPSTAQALPSAANDSEVPASLQAAEFSGDAPHPAITDSADLQVPLAGYANQDGPAEGLWEDGWIANPFICRLRLQRPICGIEIEAYLPESHSELQLHVDASGRTGSWRVEPVGYVCLRLNCELGKNETLILHFTSDATYSPARAGGSADTRNLMIHLREVRLLHPTPEV